MDSTLVTLLKVLLPLFIGFLIHLRKPMFLSWVNLGVSWIIYIILTLMGMGLAQLDNIFAQMGSIVGSATVVFVVVMGCNLIALMIYDRRLNKVIMGEEGAAASKGNLWEAFSGSIKQVSCVVLGLFVGLLLPNEWQPPHDLVSVALGILLFLIGVQLRSSNISFRHVFFNKHGIITAVIFVVSCWVAGILVALLLKVPVSQGLAVTSSYGWYSLSSIIMTNNYGPLWGAIALTNDLAREIFALVMIPVLMRRYGMAAVGSGGATSLDFVLPVIQRSGGIEMVTVAISFGFIVNILAPVLMLFFANSGW